MTKQSSTVAEHLGLADPQAGLLGAARAAWPRWCRNTPALAVVEDLSDLRAWTRTQQTSTVDELLHPLTVLASPRGDDDLAAVGAVAWALLPAAIRLAASLGDLSPDIDEMVAAQLWLEIRTFPWETRSAVSAGLRAKTRAAVLRDLGVPPAEADPERRWIRRVSLEGLVSDWEPQMRDHEEGMDPDLADSVLDRSVTGGIITEADRDLLTRLAEVAAEKGVRSGRGAGGLCAPAVLDAVARFHGVSPATLRRRAVRSLKAIAQARAGWVS